MGKAEDEFEVLRQLAQDYRSVVEGLRARGWIEEQQEPKLGLVTSTELARPESGIGYIAINFYIHHASLGNGNNTVTVRLVTKAPDDDRIKMSHLIRCGWFLSRCHFCSFLPVWINI